MGAWIPARNLSPKFSPTDNFEDMPVGEDYGNDALFVMPEVTCRASIHLLFLDSRQGNAGMTDGGHYSKLSRKEWEKADSSGLMAIFMLVSNPS